MATYDTWNCDLYGLPYPIYFYFYSKKEMLTPTDSAPIGNCPSLLSVQFSPYLIMDDFDIEPNLYDVERFGKISLDRPQLPNTPVVMRINSIKEDARIKHLASLRIYPKPSTNIGGGRYWGNESKLLQYPYSFAILTDGISPPFQVKYHLVNSDKMNIKVRNTLSDRCSYGIFVDNYKGDKSGQLEAVVSGDIHELPCSSSAYNQWFASSKNSTAQAVNQSINQAFINSSQSSQMTSLSNRNSYINQNMGMLASGMMGIGAFMTGNFGGVLGSGGMAINNGIQSGQQRAVNNLNNQFAQEQASFDKRSAIQGALAQVKDLNNTPNTMVSMGSDFIYGYNKQGSALKLYRFSITTEYATKLGDYFALYGYKQNKIMNLSEHLNTRYYYNYIKTIGANLSSKGNIEKDDLNIMKTIFDKGVTIWHIENNNVEVGNYSMDNYEI